MDADPKGGNDRVFISYNHQDVDFAQRIVSLLVLNAVPVWWDAWDVRIGDSIYSRVVEGVTRCRFLAVLLSSRSINSRWVQEELDMAKVRELEEQSVVILPLKIEEVALPLALRTKRYADFTDFDKGFDELMRTLRPHGRRSVAPAAWRAFREDIISTASEAGGRAGELIHSQAQARLLQESTFQLSQATADSSDPPSADAIVYFAFRAVDARLPLPVSLDEPCRDIVKRLAQVLALPETYSRARARYILVHDGNPLEMTRSLRDEGVAAGATLNVACLTYVIE